MRKSNEKLAKGVILACILMDETLHFFSDKELQFETENCKVILLKDDVFVSELNSGKTKLSSSLTTLVNSVMVENFDLIIGNLPSV